METKSWNSRIFTEAKFFACLLLAGAAALGLQPQARAADSPDPYANETPAQRDARMAWWREARFGLFIHWGVYSVPAGEWNGKRVSGGGEWIMNCGAIPVADYAKLPAQFNPTKFNADQWVKLAKDAGMKYIVITAKHHDGFAMFKSEASPFNIVDATPFKRDPLAELAAACRKYGLKLGFYYSQAQDWNHPGGAAIKVNKRTTDHWDKAQDGDMDKYLDEVAVPQVRELLSNYGEFPAVIWWDTPRDMTKERADKLVALLKLKPGIIQNNRLGGGYKGDTETPEQKIPATGFPGRDWETCMTMNGTWGYKKYDNNWKSTAKLIRNLVDIASKGGNYLLNVGPTSEGLIPQPSVERLKAIGAWMKVNGEAIYDTTASPFSQLAWGRCTKKISGDETTLYLHVFDWPTNGILLVPGLKNQVEQAYELKKSWLGHEMQLKTAATADGVEVSVPASAPDKISSTIVLKIKGTPEIAETPIATNSVLSATNRLDLPVAPGPFGGTRDSLTNYSCPDWFRDAKFGIWAHWGPQAVPMEGDWYARKMYQQGTPQYNDHLARWGHPSTNGWKDIVPLWKAENWDPEKLIELYKKAGAKYFVSMGSHHDDFFLWNSKLHKWNAVLVGPHRDVVGEWQAAAKKNGLPFGVSEHLGASFSWFQDSHKSDKTGPLAGVPYDGANSNYWDLYHFPAAPDDHSSWYTKDPRWQQQWYYEIKELVDNYHPDLLYSDGPVPFGNEVGLSQIANLYNLSAADHGGKTEAIYNCKETSGGRWVQDYERGVGGGISPDPWQTDTSIGDWFYNRHWKYQPLSWTVHMLVDIVSKNGNLLLNVVLRPDGTLDPEVETMLQQLADWTASNGEAIYGTRPWLVYGEGTVRARGGAFKEDYQYSAKDIRFTTKGATLYAIALGWPENGKLLIRSLAATDDAAQNKIEKVELLGRPGELKFSQTTNGLAVELPGEKLSDLTCSLRITGRNFKPVPVPVAPAVISADARGRLIFGADDATLHGEQIKLEEQGGKPNIGYWDKADEWASWSAHIEKPGKYLVSATMAAANGEGEFVLEAAGEKLAAKIPQTAGWDKFATMDIGAVDIKSAGDFTVAVRAKDAATWTPINLASLRFTPETN